MPHGYQCPLVGWTNIILKNLLKTQNYLGGLILSAHSLDVGEEYTFTKQRSWNISTCLGTIMFETKLFIVHYIIPTSIIIWIWGYMFVYPQQFVRALQMNVNDVSNIPIKRQHDDIIGYLNSPLTSSNRLNRPKNKTCIRCVNFVAHLVCVFTHRCDGDISCLL